MGPSPAHPRRGDDADLPAVRAAQADRSAFEVLYRRYLDRVYGYAFYQLGDHHDAEDATERIFLAALRGIGEYSDRGSTFRAWLFRIAHNTVVNVHRSRSRHRTEPLPPEPAWPAPDADPAGLGRARRRDALRHARRWRGSPTIAGRSCCCASLTVCRRPRSVRCWIVRRARCACSCIERCATSPLAWDACNAAGRAVFG